MKLSDSICQHKQLFEECPICNPDDSREPYTSMMLKEQRKAALIGDKPCEWDAQQWAEWQAKEE